MSGGSASWYRCYGKRLLDVILSGFLILLLSPFLVGSFLSVWFSLGTPILFRQSRPGLHGRVFEIFKFRTMRNERDRDGKLLADRERITRFGRFLRSASLDELPELVNVLRGEMSLVGPRPLLVEYLGLYSDEQRRRHEVRPGITGWAQVNGRNNLDWEDRFKLDVWYVDNLDFWLDLRILLSTVSKTLSREGISQDGHATMKPFQGNG